MLFLSAITLQLWNNVVYTHKYIDKSMQETETGFKVYKDIIEAEITKINIW